MSNAELKIWLIGLDAHVKTLELRIQNLEKITGLGPQETRATPVPVKTDEAVTKPNWE